MSQLSLILHLHLPHFLKPYSLFEVGSHQTFLDEKRGRERLKKLAEEVLIPANRKLLKLKKGLNGFQCGMLISGPLIDQMEAWHPVLLDSFRELANEEVIEFLASPHHHSLSFQKDREVFQKEVEINEEKIFSLFGQRPKILANTGLIYLNHLGYLAGKMDFEGVLIPQVYEESSSLDYLYHPPHEEGVGLIQTQNGLSQKASSFLKEGKASKEASSFQEDLAAFTQLPPGGSLFLDYLPLGQKKEAANSPLDLLSNWMQRLSKKERTQFLFPSEVVRRQADRQALDVPAYLSEAGWEQPFSPWLSNAFQEEAFEKLFDLDTSFEGKEAEKLFKNWCLLKDADQLAAMSTEDDKETEMDSTTLTPQLNYRAFLNMIADLQLVV